MSHWSQEVGPFEGRRDLAFDRVFRPVVRFMRLRATGGLVLLGCTVVAIALANSSLAAAPHRFWHAGLGMVVGTWRWSLSLEHWVNDGLMTLFFFVVGLEIKRELVAGHLAERRHATLPAAAAIGGMLVPAAIYLLLQWGEPAARGWGIPMATDIAFVVGCLALLGERVPRGLTIFALALAIIDDIGAVLVIALFYAEHLALPWLVAGAGGFVVALLLRRVGVRWLSVYVLVGIAIWSAFLASGVHPTVAGVVLGLMAPADQLVDDERFGRLLSRVHEFLRAESPPPLSAARHAALQQLAAVAQETVAPVERLENALQPWVTYFVMPVFALANAGVRLSADQLGHPVQLAVSAGLLLGKPVGIVLFSWGAVRLGLARLPDGVNWRAVAGVGVLAGIGFTMSLFIAQLGLAGDALRAAKVGILVGSTLAGVTGLAWLHRAL